MRKDGRPVIALIPARGGSKGLLRKDLVNLAGKPLIAYTIEAAQKSKFIDMTWVSSDDEEILSVAKSRGVIPLLRPNSLATDSASASSVVEHFISKLPNEFLEKDALIVYLQPTSPLRSGAHIDCAINEMDLLKVDTLVSVVESDKSPFKSFLIGCDGKLISLFDEKLTNQRRQELPKCFFPNGAIYAFKISSFLDQKRFPSNGSIPFIMPLSVSIDIDNKEHLLYAEDFLRVQNG